ncbi:DUF4383 domain-containing protein [Paenibacillus sp. TRM 82003]|uniref:DUF4383 domain-containing protein n=1 Tax=Kineococcus sp. TRM81007 TaxID=2925831 RepID=UPI001F5705BB|nr:DUF4383 domain-containing protein [Kineococcus sp. TRM81007]MCI2237190.1 DUF4383 domain-containing protein [Kineococcus sp. TRM81007]MCI3925311.1 DUF4383 domain-containing protein [Paenibacillus sp. TRM 82003]
MSASPSTPVAIEAPPADDGPIAKFARAVGALLIVLGALQFVPGVTTNYDELEAWGSGAQLFGLFTVSATGAILTMTVGALCVAFSGSPRQGHKTVVWTGLLLITAAIGGAGLVFNSPNPELPVDDATNWLHLGLGLAILVGSKAAKEKYVKDKGVL